MNRAANRVAQALLALSDAPLEPIGLLLPKSAALAVAMLGTLKAGKICVPMDPAFPAARLALMFADMQARFLVVNRASLEAADAFAGYERLLNIDEVDINWAVESPNLSCRADDPACIFYTSGSTGSPKGVIENHRNLLYHTMRDTNEYHICAEDRVTFVASSGRDIFRAILNGAAVYPIDVRQEDFAGLAQWMMEQEITILNCVTSAFRSFALALHGDEAFPCLRLIGLTGETVYKSDFELYKKHFSDACVLVNRYGPNEVGRIAQYLLSKRTVITTDVVPVGYLASGKTIQLVDDDGELAAIGQTGEIVVKSRYVSPGYWRQPELSRTAFPVDPLDGQMRVYHTGDIGAMAPDGCLVHLGRTDFQVKIRGNKVNFTAIETALRELEIVQEAAVIAVDDDNGDKRLIGYVVAKTMTGSTTSTLRDALTERFPAFMIPSAFVYLDQLPLTGIGKIDRRALPVPDRRRPAQDGPYVAPRNEVEAKLSAIWAEVLGLTDLGVLDNFLHLGGHSLAASRVISRVIETFRLQLPVKALFDAPTVAQMAAVISASLSKQASDVELARMLSEVEALTDIEAQELLSLTYGK